MLLLAFWCHTVFSSDLRVKKLRNLRDKKIAKNDVQNVITFTFFILALVLTRE